ncbi:MAG: Obg family GTPase CgtA [Sphaerochaetaceae bacterium]
MLGFSDETYIDVASGRGGAGCVSFRREKFVPKGGPDGGDGGKGGDVVFVVSQSLRTLDSLKMKRSYVAENGQGGQGARCYGRDGRDVEILVPPGTVIKDAQTGEIIKDLSGESRFVFLKGGEGGLGNWHFRTATRQAPRFAQPGGEGISMRVGVEILTIADIGFVGFPNAGKSSLLNLLTNARSKVADYPFTTRIPQLGMMRYGDQDLVLADIPGIIEGASRGLGMGIKFLKHISRTKVLAFFIDLTSDDYLEAFRILCQELEGYAPQLLEKGRVLLGTKLDEPETAERLEKLRAMHSDERVQGLSIYMEETIEAAKQAFIELASKKPEPGFTSVVDNDAYYAETHWSEEEGASGNPGESAQEATSPASEDEGGESGFPEGSR